MAFCRAHPAGRYLPECLGCVVVKTPDKIRTCLKANPRVFQQILNAKEMCPAVLAQAVHGGRRTFAGGMIGRVFAVQDAQRIFRKSAL